MTGPPGMPVLPSGEQHEIRHGGHRAAVTEVGGGLRSYHVDEWEVLDGYDQAEMCSGARGAALLPWPNRLQDGRYEFQGRTHQTPLTEPAQGNAIHGLTRWMNWVASVHEEDRVVMTLLLHPQPGYPFTLALAIEYRLTDDGLTVRTTGRNAGSQPLPYGAGHHPYVAVGTESIDDMVVRVPALLRLETNDRQIPTGRVIPVGGTAFDFLEPRPLGDTQLDTAFASLLADAQGITRIEVQAPGGRPRLQLWMDAAYPYVMVFTGDALEDASRRRRGLGLEPMTCAPNAFRSGAGLRVLGPRDTFSSTWGITF